VRSEPHARALLMRRLHSLFADTRATQIAEFAVALPLLMVMVVGILDFGNAYNLKQKVTNTAREAASMGASQPTSDIASSKQGNENGQHQPNGRTTAQAAPGLAALNVNRTSSYSDAK